MANKKKYDMLHWNYFLSIESDLEHLTRYIEFDKSNYGCFSIEITRLLLSSAAEAGNVCKELCRILNPKSKANGIFSYRDEIIKKYMGIVDFAVILPEYNIEETTPWSCWKNSNSPPKWWSAYNKVKHPRIKNYQYANLKNAIESVAGLFAINLYFYNEKEKVGLRRLQRITKPKIFKPLYEKRGGLHIEEYDLSFMAVGR